MARNKVTEDLKKTIADLERQLSQAKYLLALQERHNKRQPSSQPNKAKTKLERFSTTRPSKKHKLTFKSSNASKPVSISSHDFQVFLKQKEKEMEDRLRSEFKREYDKQYNRAIKQLRKAGAKRGLKYIHLKSRAKKGGKYGGRSLHGKKGRYSASRGSPRIYVKRERFTEAQKAIARDYHEWQAREAGFKKYHPIEKSPARRAHIIHRQKVDIQEKAYYMQIDLDKVIWPKGGAHTSKMTIKHLAKLRSYLTNPNSKELKRPDVWKKVLAGKLAIGSPALENALRETRDIVGDYYGIDTP